MAEKINIPEKYIYSIVEILDVTNQGTAGTGFLVAPGYILTCAHVILQALNIDMKNWEEYKNLDNNKLSAEIPLQFCAAANYQTITAKIVEWEPYSINKGDLAGLKLIGSTPKEAKPIKLIQVSLEEVQDAPCVVYGFGDAAGNDAEAYCVKTISKGGRFQLSMRDKNNDETIKEGYSGSPVWCQEQGKGYFIGMIATALIDQKKAFAIPKMQLDTVLQSLDTQSLADVIEEEIKRSNSDLQRRLTNAINLAFSQCDANSPWIDKQDNLLERLKGLNGLGRVRLNNTQPLAYFAVILANMSAVPTSMYNQLRQWVISQGINFETLQTEVIRDIKDLPDSSYPHEHLMIQIRADETDKEVVYITIWVIHHRDRYEALEPPKPLILEEKRSKKGIIDFLDECIDEKCPFEEPMVHFFVPHQWLADNFDSCKSNQSGYTLGSQYPFVTRADLTQSPSLPDRYYKSWKRKWEQLFENNIAHVEQVDTTKDGELLKLKKAEMALLKNLSSERVENFFRRISRKTALPVALWVRSQGFDQEAENILKFPPKEIPKRVHEERIKALESDQTNCHGHHLSLVWEDVKLVLPSIAAQLIQENY